MRFSACKLLLPASSRADVRLLLSLLSGSYPRKKWQQFVTEENKRLCPPEALDLLDKLLVFDHQVHGAVLRLFPRRSELTWRAFRRND